MALSGHDEGDLLGWDEEDMSSLTKSGHVLKEEHMGLWADANKAKISLEGLWVDLRRVIDLGLKNLQKHPHFPCFSLLLDMGENLSMPWKTIATAIQLLWRYAKAQLQKKNPNLAPATQSPYPYPSPITPPDQFVAYFQSLSPKEIHILSYGCLLLASKSEETLFSLRVLNDMHHNYFVIREVDKNPPVEPWQLTTKDISFDQNWLSTMVKNQEVSLLVDLGFNLTIRHLSHLRLLRLMNALEVPAEHQTKALSLANLCLLTSSCLINRPRLFAVSLLYLVSQASNYQIQLPASLLPRSGAPQNWWSLFNVSSADMQTALEPVLGLLDDLGLREEFCGGNFNSNFPRNENELAQLRSISSGLTESGAQLTGFCVNHSLNDTGEELTEQAYPCCRPLEEFQKEKKISEGTYGTVYVGVDKVTSEVVAIKKMKRTMSRSGFPYYMLREILFLFRLNHPNIVAGKAMAIEKKKGEITFYIMMEFISTDMLSLVKFQASIIREHRIRLSQVKNVMYQLLAGLTHMHEQGLMHRDLKLANLLLTRDGTLKVADLGSIRDIGRTALKLTTQIVTLWYRAPELLMGGTEYSHSIDIWSVGCLFVELLTLKPLFPGSSELETMIRIFKVLGRPSDSQWKCFRDLPLAPKLRQHFSRFPSASTLKSTLSFLSPAGHDFLAKALELDPNGRITAKEALQHPFWTERPLPQPILLEKVGMVTVFDEKNLEMEAEVMNVADDNEKFKKFEKYAKKD